MKTSKSPKAIATWAYAVAKAGLPAYSHERSPKKFTQHQLFTLLVLKQYFKKDYRSLVEIVEDFSDIRKILELEI